MTIDRFMVFAAVAKHHNVTRASEELHISQPAVTKQLKLLEQNYKTKLFDRASKGMQLTERGRVFLREIQVLLKRYERLQEKYRATRPESAVQTLIVGGSYSPSAYLLPSLLALFKSSHPDVQLELRTSSRAGIEGMLLHSEADIAVINNAASHPLLISEPYRKVPLVAFVAKNHPLSTIPRSSWQTFGPTPLIIIKPVGGGWTAEQLMREMKTQGLTPNIVMRCETPEAVKAAVASKMGMGILFRETIELEVRRGQFKLVKLPLGNLSGESYIVYRNDRPLSAPAQEFRQILRQGRQPSIGDRRRNKQSVKRHPRTD